MPLIDRKKAAQLQIQNGRPLSITQMPLPTSAAGLAEFAIVGDHPAGANSSSATNTCNVYPIPPRQWFATLKARH